jgi:hypothetical protein
MESKVSVEIDSFAWRSFVGHPVLTPHTILQWEIKFGHVTFFILYSGARIRWAMLKCRLYLQLWTCHYTKVCIRYGKSDLRVAYPHELMSCLCPHNEAAVLWRVAYCYWPWSIIDACCVVNRDCVIIYHYAALEANKLVQLRGCLWSFIRIHV